MVGVQQPEPYSSDINISLPSLYSIYFVAYNNLSFRKLLATIIRPRSESHNLLHLKSAAR